MVLDRYDLRTFSPPENLPGPSRSPPTTPPPLAPVPKTKPLSPDTSLIPGETEEDGMLRREYVLVGDRQAVEINRAVDGMSLGCVWKACISYFHPEITSRRRPLKDRRPSPLGEDMPEYPILESPSPTSANTTFPPPPIPLSSSPSSASPRGNGNALTRALNIATGILRGSRRRPSSYQFDYTPSSPRRMQTFGGTRGQGLGLELQGVRDAEEDDLLTNLEELAQKTEVLTHWADEMYDYVKAFPQSKWTV